MCPVKFQSRFNTRGTFKEVSAIKKVRFLLIQNGFYVKKLSDKSTTGIPDSFIAKGKKGLFVEFKAIETILPIPLDKVIKKFDLSVQLDTMIELERHFGNCLGAVIIKVSKEYWVAEWNPLDIYQILVGGRQEIEPNCLVSLDQWCADPGRMF